MSSLVYTLALCVVALALAYVAFNYMRIKKMKEGTDEMIEMAGIIRSGSNAFMITEYKTISVVVAIIAIVFSLFIEATSGITFLMGTCIFLSGMLL